MKQFMLDFIKRGLYAYGFGPMVVAIIYLCLDHQHVIEEITIQEICLGIFSSAALAFVVGGMSSIYQIERLHLMTAILIHGGVLYLAYFSVYLINGWLKWGMIPLLSFSGIFVLGYFVIWLIIYLHMRSKTAKINKVLKEKQ